MHFHTQLQRMQKSFVCIKTILDNDISLSFASNKWISVIRFISFHIYFIYLSKDILFLPCLSVHLSISFYLTNPLTYKIVFWRRTQ